MPKELEKLAKSISKGYISKGYGAKKSKSIGFATANKILRGKK